VEHFDRRSAEVAQIEKLSIAVARTGEPVWDTNDLPEPIARSISELVDQTASRCVNVLVLSAPTRSDPLPLADKKSVGVLVFESFAGNGFDPSARQTAHVIARHSGLAINNALQFARIADIDEKLDLSFANGDEDLARRLVRRKLESKRLGDEVRAAMDGLTEELESLTGKLERQRDELDGLRQKASVFIRERDRGLDPMTAIDETEVEAALLAERDARQPS